MFSFVLKTSLSTVFLLSVFCMCLLSTRDTTSRSTVPLVHTAVSHLLRGKHGKICQFQDVESCAEKCVYYN